MQKILFLHVGFPKTGTTSIQKFFDVHKVSCGIEYIDSREDRHREFWASILYELGNRKGKVLQYNFSSGDCYKTIDRYIRQIEDSSNDKFLISFEGLISLAKADTAGILRHCMEKFVDAGIKVVAIFYVRSIRSYWESKYLSDAKTKDVGSFSNWIFNQLKTEASPHEVMLYFNEVTGDNLIIEYYNSEAVNSEGLVKHFLKALQYPWQRCDVTVSSTEVYNAGKDNVSLSKLRKKRGLPELDGLSQANEDNVEKEFKKYEKIITYYNKKNRELFQNCFGVASEDINLKWIISTEEKYNLRKQGTNV